MLLRSVWTRALTSMASAPPIIAVCQMNCSHDLNANFEKAKLMMLTAKQRNAQMVFFPECVDFIGRNNKENVELAMSADSEFIGGYRKLAKEFGLWLSLGGFHHKEEDSTQLPYNTHLIMDSDGVTRASYNKLHLFNLSIPGRVCLLESDFSSAGKSLVKPVETPVGRVSLSICYDVRFAELALWHRVHGAHILTYPSAFTVNTGLAHWETLLRARAIESQCYVVAPAQTGKHNNERSSYGHSMVVDPWGAVIAQCSDTVDICFAEISMEYLNKVRSLQPVFEHRRADVYSLVSVQSEDIGAKPFMFGDHVIPENHVFYKTDSSFCFVNRSPVLAGHVLVCPLRSAYHLLELSDAETSDLFITAKRVQAILEKHFETSSSTVCIQDGPHAGRTVEHVHIHIMPRRKDDFGGETDQVYRELAEHDKSTALRKTRDVEEMSKEAMTYRNLMQCK